LVQAPSLTMATSHFSHTEHTRGAKLAVNRTYGSGDNHREAYSTTEYGHIHIHYNDTFSIYMYVLE
jgi:hypothetical protein